MAVAVRAEGGAAGSGSTLSVTVPAGVVEGDLVLLLAQYSADGPPASVSAGWSPVAQLESASSSGGSVRGFWRRAQAGTAGSTCTMTWGASVRAALGVVVVFDDSGAAVNVDAAAAFVEAARRAVATTPGVSPTKPGSLVLAVAGGMVGESGTTPTFAAAGGFAVLAQRGTVTGLKNVVQVLGTQVWPGGLPVAATAWTPSAGTVSSSCAALVLASDAQVQAPLADAGADQQVAAGAQVTLDGSGSSTPSGTVTGYTWSQLSGPSVALSSTSAPSPSFTAPSSSQAYTLTFGLVVSDSRGLSSAQDTVAVAVAAQQLPVADAGPDVTVGPGAQVTLDGSGSHDPDGTVVSYSWSQLSGPAVALSSSSSASASFEAPQVSATTVLEFGLRVTDDNGLTSARDVVVVTVAARPLARAWAPPAVTETDVVTLDGSASVAPSGRALSFAWSQLSGPAVTLSSTSQARPSFAAPAAGQPATVSFGLVVTDELGLSSEMSVVTLQVMPMSTAVVRVGGEWARYRLQLMLEPVPEPPVFPDPDPDPGPDPDPEPDPDDQPEPGVFTHGRQVTPARVGVRDTGEARTVVTEDTVVTSARVFRDIDFVGTVTVQAPAEFYNCSFTGPTAGTAGSYTVRVTNAGGARVVLADCTITSRLASTKGLAAWGPVNLEVTRCVIRGGQDAVAVQADAGYAATFTECYLGDLQPGSSRNAVRVDGGTGELTFQRCKLLGLTYPAGDVPGDYDLDAALAGLGSSAFTLALNAAAPVQISNITLADCHLDGGNYTVNTRPAGDLPPTDIRVLGCTFGLRRQFGPVLAGTGTVWRDNRWAYSGATVVDRADYLAVAGQLLPGQSPPDVEPEPDPTLPPPAGFDHGAQVTARNVGMRPTGEARTAMAGGTLTQARVYRNVDFTGTVIPRANIEFHNCTFTGAVDTRYVVHATTMGGASVKFFDCTITGRNGAGKTVVSWNAGNLEFYRCVIRGGTDAVFSQSHPGYITRFSECYIGDVQRVPGSHSDAFQIDAGAGQMEIVRCHISCFNYPTGDTPDMYDLDSATAEMASGGIILTQNEHAPAQISNLTVDGCYFDGGNFMLDTAPPDGLPPTNIVVRDCTFGLRTRYGPIRVGANTTVSNVRWAQAGVTRHKGAEVTVTAGQEIPL